MKPEDAKKHAEMRIGHKAHKDEAQKEKDAGKARQLRATGIDLNPPYAMVIALAVAIALLFLLSATPLHAIRLFFIGPFSSLYNFGNMLGSSMVLIMAGIASSTALKSGSFNLGGEGQIYAGGLAAALTAIALGPSFPGGLGIAIGILAAAAASGIIGGISGWCKMKWGTNEMISSFLLSGAVTLVIDYLITGPFMDPQANLLTTSKIPQSMWLSRILKPSSLSSAIIVAIAAAAAVHIWVFETKSGFKLRMMGQSYRFAVYSGFNTKLLTWLPMFISGALHGAGGALAVFGTYHACLKGFHSGMGWNGLAVALLAGYNPLFVIPAAVFYSWIESGARLAMQSSDVSSQIASIIQATLFFFITCRFHTAKAKGALR